MQEKSNFNLLNTALPRVMHIDLNSCFAIIEQQANRLLRGRPVGVAAYDTPHGFVLAASYEAKAKGVKLGVNVAQARAMCPGIVIMTPDPAKYREAHKRFKELMLEYSPDVVPKSIDEFVLNMERSPAIRAGRSMEEIGLEIKQKIHERLGEAVTVNIGIGPNRFLAKYAAGFDKPDGMTRIDHTNLRQRYDGMKLVDLPGIHMRFRARLRAAGIFTPLDFLDADLNTLKKRVFKSINGYYWYLRLRGHEIDDVEFSRKSIGHQYALSDKTADIAKLERLLMKLCEKTGRRLRKNELYAKGIHLYLGFISEHPAGALDHAFSQPTTPHAAPDPFFPQSRSYGYALSEENESGAHLSRARSNRKRRLEPDDGPASFENMHNIRSWHHGEHTDYRLYSTQDIYQAAKRLLHRAEITGRVKLMAVTVFNLSPWDPQQLGIFDIEPSEKGRVETVARDIRSVEAEKRISDAIDIINNRYGEFVITPAMMMDMQGEILDRVAFGQVRDV